jgi:hypothetical protein
METMLRICHIPSIPHNDCVLILCVRYGHNFIAIADDVLAVVGGCAVSPQGEAVGSSESPSQTKALIELSNHLQVSCS